MIDVEGLTKVYGGSHKARALDQVSLSVPKGDVFGFLGPNGAGKTTTIRILATVLEPTEGTVRIDGHDVLASAAVVWFVALLALALWVFHKKAAE